MYSVVGMYLAFGFLVLSGSTVLQHCCAKNVHKAHKPDCAIVAMVI